MKLFLTLALLLPLVSNAQNIKSLVGFQGIPWGSSMAAVKAKFPQAKEIDLCKELDKIQDGSKTIRQQYREEDTSCAHLLVENYTVSGGVNYDLAFYFTYAGRIDQVNLSKYFRQRENPEYLTECAALFERTNNLLGINYGNGMTPANINEMKSSYRNIAAMLWIPMPTEIVLKRQWGHILLVDANRPDLCQVSISYSKRGVDKL
jgi:hypothetical protein